MLRKVFQVLFIRLVGSNKHLCYVSYSLFFIFYFFVDEVEWMEG